MIICQISPFQYVSILISIILGLGMTHTLSSVAELLFHHRKIKLYWPHTIWVLFVLFLHTQYWIVIYELKEKEAWRFLDMIFVLLYPIFLFLAAKILLPSSDRVNQLDMKAYYKSQFPILFVLISICIFLSIIFNIYYLGFSFLEQSQLMIFLIVASVLAFKKTENEGVHKAFSIAILLGVIISVVLQHDIWIIK